MSATSQKTLITIVGPTAIGKTALSIKLAQHFNSEIISCDSRQFYKEMTIGTAVPNTDELAKVNHYFIQNRSIFENYSVGQFERDALIKLKKLFQKNDVVIMVGGSGLYTDAVLKGLDYFPDVSTEIREKINKLLQEKGITFLQEQLKKLDIETYNSIDLKNPHRLIRALEIYVETGSPYSSFKNNSKISRNFKSIKIGLNADRQLIYDRINERVDDMINDGLLKEAKSLYPNRNLNALQTVGYRELFSYFDGTISKEFAVEEIKKNTRRFAKRQLTWFRRDKEIKWFDFKTDIRQIISDMNLRF